MKLFLLIFFLRFSALSIAQEGCDCKQMLFAVINSIENDYVDRENINQNKYYQKLKKSINSKKLPQSIDSCASMIYYLVSSFQDNHITFAIDNPPGTLVKFPFDSVKLLQSYEKSKAYSKNKNTIEGLWGSQGGEQEYLITKIRNKDAYYVLIWKSTNVKQKVGQLKGIIKKISFSKYLFTNYIAGKTILVTPLIKDGFLLNSVSTGRWHKIGNGIDPIPKQTFAPQFEKLSDSVLMLTIPSFDAAYKKVLDSILDVNKETISRTKYLIINLKVNYGGVIGTYEKILKWMYTNPIRIEGGYYFSSPTSISILKSDFNARNDSGSASWTSSANFIRRMEESPGKLVIDSGYYIRYDSIQRYPEKIFVLSGTNCMSAGELFLISAMQSKKVTILGENSAGSIDRADAILAKTGCSNLRLTIPIALRVKEIYKHKIDGVGIPPKIRIPKNTNWVDFVLKNLVKR